MTYKVSVRRLRQEAADPPPPYVPSPGDLVRAPMGNSLVHTIKTVARNNLLTLACGQKRHLAQMRPVTSIAPFRECDRCSRYERNEETSTAGVPNAHD